MYQGVGPSITQQLDCSLRAGKLIVRIREDAQTHGPSIHRIRSNQPTLAARFAITAV
jgi:hypothetical protein